jgi:5'(3')-deoxyribonucleotidase
MSRPVVLLDCDGVLSDFVSAVLDLVHELCGPRYQPHDVTCFDLAKSLGLTDEERARVFGAITSRPGFARELAVYPDAIAGVAALRAVADVYIVTSPWNSNPTWTHDREAWLREHFGIPHSHVIHTSAKHLVAGDVLVDDKTSTLVEWQAAHPRGVAVQWQTPHNLYDGWAGWSTCSWDHVARAIATFGACAEGRS